MVFLGHRGSLCCLAAHPQAPFLSRGESSPKKSWQEAVLRALGCSLSPQPHAPCTQGLAWDPGSAELGAPPGPHLEVTSVLQRRGGGKEERNEPIYSFKKF